MLPLVVAELWLLWVQWWAGLAPCVVGCEAQLQLLWMCWWAVLVPHTTDLKTSLHAWWHVGLALSLAVSSKALHILQAHCWAGIDSPSLGQKSSFEEHQSWLWLPTRCSGVRAALEGMCQREQVGWGKHQGNTGTNFFQIPVNEDILTSSLVSWVLLMASRMVNPFQVFNLLCQDPSEESTSIASIAL